MALALLELVDQEDDRLHFRIDTGTNLFFQLRAGTGIRRDLGIELLEDVYFSTPITRNPSGGAPLDSSSELEVSMARLNRSNTYAQLFSFKNEAGRSPAFSRPVRLALAGTQVLRPQRERFITPHSSSMTVTMNGTTHKQARRIPHRSATLARQASLDELLGRILKVAGPLVGGLLKGGAAGSTAPGGLGTSAAGPSGTDAAAVLTTLLRSLVGSADTEAPALGRAASLSRSGNRFSGALDLGAGAGQLGGAPAQGLPGLMNAAAQERLLMKQADNLLVGNILADIERRSLLEEVGELLQPAEGSEDQISPGDVVKLLEALRQMPTGQVSPAAATATKPAATAPPVIASPAVATPALGFPGAGTPVPLAPGVVTPAVGTPPAVVAPTIAKGLSMSIRSRTLSNRAVLAFELGPALPWNGTDMPLFSRGTPITLRVRLNVGEPAPKAPLAKALLKLVLRDSVDASSVFEKVYQFRDVHAGQLLECVVEPADMIQLPANTPIAVSAQLRWLNGAGVESCALGSTDLVLVNRYYLGDRGRSLEGELELYDMKAYRPFWNKVWESPVLNGSRGGSNDRKKLLWELDVALRYTVIVSAKQTANGLMETRIQSGRESESLTERTRGRMKGGIELSVSELNKLLPKWAGARPLDAEKLEAFQGRDFLRQNATELIYAGKLKGKARQRGMVWVVPVLQLCSFELTSASEADAGGQITRTTREPVTFPLPTAARLLALVSSGTEDARSDETEPVSVEGGYAFDGFDLVWNQKVALAAPNPEVA